MRRVGSTVPRIFTPPLRELTPETSLGFSVIQFAEAIGVELYPWQKWLFIHMLELTPRGRLRFRVVVIIVGRQNGKSTMMKIFILWLLYIRGVRLVVGTAQDLETAESLWEETVELAEMDLDLSDEIARVDRRNGAKALVIADDTGSHKYQVKSVAQSAAINAGRGKTADAVVLDELRAHKTWDAYAAISKTILTREDGIIVAPSNAGDDTSVVLKSLRRLSHLILGDPDQVFVEVVLDDVPDDGDGEVSGEPPAIFEWSAPPGSDIWDRDGWALANPSMNFITEAGRNALPEENIAADARTSMADAESLAKFLNEVMCQWVDEAKAGAFPLGSWAATLDQDSSVPDDPTVFGLDVSWTGSTAYVAWAGLRPDGDPHAEVCAARAGVDWVVPWFESRALVRPLTVVLQGRGAQVSPLADDLEKIPGLTVELLQGPDLGKATNRLWHLVRNALPDEQSQPVSEKMMGQTTTTDDGEDFDPVQGRRLHRMPQPLLDVAAAGAVTKSLADGMFLFDRKKSSTDISPLVAVMCAVWRATQPVEVKRSAYENSGLLVV